MHSFFKQQPKRSWIVLLLAVIVIGGVALSFILRPRKEPPSRMAPDGTLAYLEVENPVNLAEQLSSTQAWMTLAPTLGWPQRLTGLGYLRQFMGLAGPGYEELDMLLSARMALVMTGIDTVGQEITPHLVLLFQPKAAHHEVEKWMETQLKSLADRAYSKWVEEVSAHAGRQIHSFKSLDGSHRIAWCVMDQAALIANHVDSIQLIIDTLDHRRPSLEENPNFQRLRTSGPSSAPVFAYVSTHPIATGLQQFSWPTNSSSSPELLAINALQIFFTAFDISLAYRLEVQDGVVVEQYHLVGPPEFNLESAKPATLPGTLPHSLQFIPQQSKSFTILRLGDPEQLVEKLDAALSRHLSAISSIALREIFIRFKRAWGLDEHDTIADAIGDEITVVEGNYPELLFIMRTKRKAKLAALIGKHLQHGGASAHTSQYEGLDIYFSTDESRKAFCFVDDLLLMGPMELVKWAIDAQQQGTSIDRVSEINSLVEKYGQGALEISIRLDHEEEARRIAAALQGMSSRSTDEGQILNLLRSLPPTIRTTRSTSQGLWTETRSPLGELPFWFIDHEPVDEVPASSSK